MNRSIEEMRQVIEKLIPMLTNKGMKVTQRGASAYVQTDPKTRRPIVVNIPFINDDASEDFISAVRGFIDHEVGHVLVTNWNFYAGGASAKDLERKEVQFLMKYHNFVEDVMIEREMAKIFIGSGENISKLRHHFIQRITKPALEKARSEQEEFSCLIVPMLRALGNHEEFQDFMDTNGYWKHSLVEKFKSELSDQFLSLIQTADTTEQTLELAKEIYDILHERKEEPPKQDRQSQDKPEQKAGPGDGDGERDHSNQEAQNGDNSDDTLPDKDPKEQEVPQESPKNGDGKDEGEASSSDDEEGDTDGNCKDESDESQSGDTESEEGKGDQENGSSNDQGETQNGDDSGDQDDADTGGDAPSSNRSDEKKDGDGDEEADSERHSKNANENLSDQSKANKGDGEEKSNLGEVQESESEVEERRGDTSSSTDQLNVGDDEGIEAEGGGGVGSASAKSLFDLEDNFAEDADISSAMSRIISENAVEAIRGSEWSTFTTEWDRVEPIDPPKEFSQDNVKKLEEVTRSMTGQMQKDIERIMASQSHVFNQPGHRRGRLHSASLHRVLIGEDRVFTQRQEHKSKDTAVMLLVDNSGSMIRRIGTAMTAVYALSSTLERVNIQHEIMGFTTGELSQKDKGLLKQARKEMQEMCITYDRYLPIVMPIYKSFGERLNSVVKRRIAYGVKNRKGLNGNIDGESLLIAARRLVARTEKRKVMIVLSDGFPAGGARSPGHLRGVVEDLNVSGIETIGIGIQSDAVKSFYQNHVVLEKLEDLPGQVMSELKSILMK